MGPEDTNKEMSEADQETANNNSVAKSASGLSGSLLVV